MLYQERLQLKICISNRYKRIKEWMTKGLLQSAKNKQERSKKKNL